MFPRLVCQKPRGPFGVLYLHMMSQPVKKARYKNCFGSFLPALNASIYMLCCTTLSPAILVSRSSLA